MFKQCERKPDRAYLCGYVVVINDKKKSLPLQNPALGARGSAPFCNKGVRGLMVERNNLSSAFIGNQHNKTWLKDNCGSDNPNHFDMMAKIPRLSYEPTDDAPEMIDACYYPWQTGVVEMMRYPISPRQQCLSVAQIESSAGWSAIGLCLFSVLISVWCYKKKSSRNNVSNEDEMGSNTKEQRYGSLN